ncbi:MAG: PD-(D/E)XK nuclease family transposase [Clostridiales Family XIII bacterium]|jgi:hypothetical protein|nr:PD-(D/E)XK nuclease family transposase [Clostridiales Family XIII bacterium]
MSVVNDMYSEEFESEIEIGVLSPLADPVVEEIYKDEEVAGLAAESFISAVLAECGEKFGNVIELTPQKRQTQLGNRSCYIDVFAKSDTGRIATQEVQLYFDPSILQRNLLEAAYSYVGGARKGTTAVEMASEMPNVSAINIFGHINNCRKENRELLQPIHCVYDKAPREPALKQFAIFNIQLPYFTEAPEDYSNLLYRWCKLLYEMHFNKKLPKEVFAMEPEMREFVESDAGAAQFVDRYSEATASPVIRQSYRDWVLADFRERSMLQGARSEGREEGREEGRLEIAKKLLKNNVPINKIIEYTELSLEKIETLRNV